MKSNWKYVCIGLIVLLVGIFSVSMYTQNKLKDKIIELQEQAPIVEYVETTDTIVINNVQTKYKTKKEFVRDTTVLVQNDSVMIEIPIHDTFYLPVEHNVYTSTLDTANFHLRTNIHYSGIEPKLDSIKYDIIIEQKKSCCWLKRLFNKCN